MNNKQKLLKKIKEEFNKNYKDLEFSYEDQQTYHIMSLIIDHIENYYHDDNDELIESILECEEPLKTLYEIFIDHIELDVVFEKVFTDFFIEGQEHRTAIETCIFCDNFYEDDQFCDDEFEDEEI